MTESQYNAITAEMTPINGVVFTPGQLRAIQRTDVNTLIANFFPVAAQIAKSAKAQPTQRTGEYPTHWDGNCKSAWDALIALDCDASIRIGRGGWEIDLPGIEVFVESPRNFMELTELTIPHCADDPLQAVIDVYECLANVGEPGYVATNYGGAKEAHVRWTGDAWARI